MTRGDAALTGEAIAILQQDVPEARILVFGAPAGLGNAGRFKLMVEATGDANLDTLQAQSDKIGRSCSPATRTGGPFQRFSIPHTIAVCRDRSHEDPHDGRAAY